MRKLTYGDPMPNRMTKELISSVENRADPTNRNPSFYYEEIFVFENLATDTA